jgi:CRP-like cAMP-binding protein
MILCTDVLFGLHQYSGMEQHSYDKLCAKITLQVFTPGSVIFRQGEAGHHAYIVLSGAVSATVCTVAKQLLVFRSSGCRSIVRDCFRGVSFGSCR